MQLYELDENGKPRLVQSKFYRDEEGHYWDFSGAYGGSNVWVPAPEWAGNINPYLFEGPNILIGTHRKPICDVPTMRAGGKSTDGNNLILTTEEKDELLRTDPQAEKFIRPFMNGKDFINRKYRWCLWLVGAEPADIRKCPRVLERIGKVREFRKKSKKKATQKKAETPMLFDEIVEPQGDYIAIPNVSSEKRKYIPMEWVSHDVIPGENIRFVENANLFLFGVLNSSVHMAWNRIIDGKLEISLRYGSTISYNAFPWPHIVRPEIVEYQTEGRLKVHPYQSRIEQTAQAILDARKLYPRSTLADLYDERSMPPELRKAHNDNDEAVMTAYGFRRHYEDDRFHEEDIVIALMYMYKDITECEEYKENYPNYEWARKCLGEDYDEEEEE